ncbi:MAG: hypothetical protein Q8867_00985 [Bacteroidota bacterium]|nr:hypothetical protein [Bacteroidota bacterium]
MTNQKLFLARTYKDISDTTYVATNWTDAEGKFTFGDLVPGYYWYRIQNWKNLGAYRVYAGIDGYTIFLVDKPDPHK